jgi:hypothetical protein
MAPKCTFHGRASAAGGVARGGYGALGGGGTSSIVAANPADPGRSGGYGALAGYGALGGHKGGPSVLTPEAALPPAKLERLPTYARLDRQASRPKTLGCFEHLDAADEDRDAPAAPVAHSARAAFRSWSLTGGTREASFRKRPTAPPASLEPTAVDSKKPRAVGFAAVLSMSGWEEGAAEEVEVTSAHLAERTAERDPAAQSEAYTRAADGVLGGALAGGVALRPYAPDDAATPPSDSDSDGGETAEPERDSFVRRRVHDRAAEGG